MTDELQSSLEHRGRVFDKSLNFNWVIKDNLCSVRLHSGWGFTSGETHHGGWLHWVQYFKGEKKLWLFSLSDNWIQFDVALKLCWIINQTHSPGTAWSQGKQSLWKILSYRCTNVISAAFFCSRKDEFFKFTMRLSVDNRKERDNKTNKLNMCGEKSIITWGQPDTILYILFIFTLNERSGFCWCKYTYFMLFVQIHEKIKWLLSILFKTNILRTSYHCKTLQSNIWLKGHFFLLYRKTKKRGGELLDFFFSPRSDGGFISCLNKATEPGHKEAMQICNHWFLIFWNIIHITNEKWEIKWAELYKSICTISHNI